MPLTFRQIFGTILEEDYVKHPGRKRNAAGAAFLVDYWLEEDAKEGLDDMYQWYFEDMPTRHEKR